MEKTTPADSEITLEEIYRAYKHIKCSNEKWAKRIWELVLRTMQGHLDSCEYIDNFFPYKYELGHETGYKNGECKYLESFLERQSTPELQVSLLTTETHLLFIEISIKTPEEK